MVQAMIDISEEANQVANIIKAKLNLRTKSEAIDRVLIEYGCDLLGPELRPEYVEKLKLIEKEGYGNKFTSVEQLRKKVERK